MKNKFYIYRIVSPNGKIYVGKTSIDPEKRWKQHEKSNLPIGCAIRKYGFENMSFEILCFCFSNDEANKLEIHYIDKFDCLRSGYNCTVGGEGTVGYTHSEYSKSKMSKSKSGKNNVFFGRKLSDVEKQRLRIANLGKPKSESTRNKISESLKGSNSPAYRDDIKIDDILDMKEKGYSLRKISRELKTNHHTIKKRLDYYYEDSPVLTPERKF